MKQDGTKLENKNPREIMSMDQKNELKRLLSKVMFTRGVTPHCKKNSILQNNKPAEFC